MPVIPPPKPLLNMTTRLEAKSNLVLGALLVVSLLAFLVTVPLPRVDGMLIGSDGVGYYMYVRSMVIDGDVDFANEYAFLYPERDVSSLRTATGLTANQFAVGPALLWLPFFVAAHWAALALNALGVPIATDGYGYLYQAAVCVGSIVYGAGAMVLMHRTARRLFPDTALLACVLLWVTTNFIYYLIIEPSMSHMCSVFATSLLMYLWVSTRPLTSLRRCLYIGMAGGLVGLVRQPDATFLLLPLLDFLLLREPISERMKRIGVSVGGFFAVFWVQMLVWNTLNGSPFLSGYLMNPEQSFSWFSPHLVEVLFSTEHGLFLWHPIYLFALAGLVWFWRTDRLLTGLLLLGFLMQLYIIAAWSYWSQADAFGGRMFLASLPIFAIGLASLFHRIKGKAFAWSTAIGVAGVLLLWNALFLVQYRMGFISMDGPYTIQELTVGKAQMLGDLVERVLR